MIPIGFGVLTVAHIGAGISGEAIWSLGFDNNASDTAAELANTFGAAIETLGYVDCLSSSVTVTEVRVKLGPDATGPSAVASVQIDGSVGGQAAPPQLATLVHKNTPLGGRKGRGRLFLPGLAEAALDQNGLITNAHKVAVETFLFDLLGGMTLGSTPPMLMHSDETAPTAISTVEVDTVLATQRRRLRR